MLFEEKLRTALGPKRQSQSDWSFMDATAISGMEEARQFLNLWVSQYPEGDDKNELICRFRSGDDVNFASASFELILFATLRSIGCEVSVHPQLGNGSLKHPDFLAVTPDGDEFYVEAVKASELGANDAKGQDRLNSLYEYFDERGCPDFHLSAIPDGFPESQIPLKSIHREVIGWLNSLNPDDILQQRQLNPDFDYPERTFEFNGWEIAFAALPKAAGKRTGVGRVIQVRQSPMRWSTSRDSIREQVKRKGKWYGDLDRPLLVAVNFEGYGVDDEDVTDALYGDSTCICRETDDGEISTTYTRTNNGVWRGPNGIQLRRVSGLWFFKRVEAWNLSDREMRIYVNGEANFGLPALLSTLPTARVENGQLAFSDGRTLNSILGV